MAGLLWLGVEVGGGLVTKIYCWDDDSFKEDVLYGELVIWRDNFLDWHWMPSPQNIYNISIPFKRKSLLYYPFWGRQRCLVRKSWLLKSLIFQPTCPVCPKDHTSQSLPRPFKRIISHAKEHVVVFRCVSGTVCKTVKGNVGVWNIICRRVGLQANELHKTSFRPFSVHNVEKFKLKEIFTEINFLTLPRISKWTLRKTVCEIERHCLHWEEGRLMRRGVKSGSLGAESWERGQLMHDFVSSSNIISNTRGETRHHCPPPLLWCHRCHPSHVFDVTLVLQRWFFTLLVRCPLQRVFMVVSICLDFNRIFPGSPKWRKHDIFFRMCFWRKVLI